MKKTKKRLECLDCIEMTDHEKVGLGWKCPDCGRVKDSQDKKSDTGDPLNARPANPFKPTFICKPVDAIGVNVKGGKDAWESS